MSKYNYYSTKQTSFLVKLCTLQSLADLGSGKSDAGVNRAIKLKIDTPHANIGYYLPTYDLIDLMAIPRFEEVLQRLELDYKVNKSKYRIDIDGYSSIILRSMQNPERIVAYETADAILDELDTLKKDDAAKIWTKVNERTRAKKPNGKPNTMSVVTTPDMGDTGFVFSRWGGDLSNSYEDIIQDDGTTKTFKAYELIKASTYQNIFLPKGYANQIKQNYDPVLADLYLSGEFVSLNQNKVFYCYDKQKHDTDRTEDNEDYLIVGLDFNIGACCFCIIVREVIKDPHSDYYGQYCYYIVNEGFKHDTFEICSHTHSTYKDNKVEFFPDASGNNRSTNASRSDIAIIRDSGFLVNAPLQNGAVRDGVISVNKLFSQNRLFVNSKRCPKISNALKSQGYTDKGEPEKYNDHQGGAIDDYTDCVRYPLMRLESVDRPTISDGSIKFF